MKRLVAGGLPRIVQFCRCFRAEEDGPFHQPEFTMIEWYRAGGTAGRADARLRGHRRSRRPRGGHVAEAAVPANRRSAVRRRSPGAGWSRSSEPRFASSCAATPASSFAATKARPRCVLWPCTRAARSRPTLPGTMSSTKCSSTASSRTWAAGARPSCSTGRVPLGALARTKARRSAHRRALRALRGRPGAGQRLRRADRSGRAARAVRRGGAATPAGQGGLSHRREAAGRACRTCRPPAASPLASTAWSCWCSARQAFATSWPSPMTRRSSRGEPPAWQAADHCGKVWEPFEGSHPQASLLDPRSPLW